MEAARLNLSTGKLHVACQSGCGTEDGFGDLRPSRAHKAGNAKDLSGVDVQVDVRAWIGGDLELGAVREAVLGHARGAALASYLLFEAGYISNVDDEALLIQPKQRAEMVLALAQAIEADVASRIVR